MITRWTLLLLSAWILFAAPPVPTPAPTPAVVCTQAQRADYAPLLVHARTRQRPLLLVAPTPPPSPYQPAPANRPPPSAR